MHQELHRFPQAQRGKGHQEHADILEFIRAANKNPMDKYERKSLNVYASYLPVPSEEECQQQALMQQAWVFEQAKSASMYRMESKRFNSLVIPAIYVCCI